MTSCNNLFSRLIVSHSCLQSSVFSIILPTASVPQSVLRARGEIVFIQSSLASQ